MTLCCHSTLKSLVAFSIFFHVKKNKKFLKKGNERGRFPRRFYDLFRLFYNFPLSISSICPWQVELITWQRVYPPLTFFFSFLFFSFIPFTSPLCLNSVLWRKERRGPYAHTRGRTRESTDVSDMSRPPLSSYYLIYLSCRSFKLQLELDFHFDRSQTKKKKKTKSGLWHTVDPLSVSPIRW